MNATWEDWEKWYQARDGQKAEPVYVSNGAFAGVIALFVIIGAWAQAARVDRNTQALVQMREEAHQNVSSSMRRKQIEKANLTREGRVDSFLKQRDGWGLDQPCNHRSLLRDEQAGK